MSVPYGQPPAGQPPAAAQPGSSSSSDAGLDLSKILALVTGGLGLIIYFLSFTGGAGLYLRTGLVGFLLVSGALLAAASVLPKAPATLVPAAVLAVTGTLFLLIDVTTGPGFLTAGGNVVETPGLAIAALVLAFLESAACVVGLLATAGVVKLTPRPGPAPAPLWGPQQPFGYPGGPAQGGYPGQQPVGPHSGGFPPQPQQPPYIPQTQQYPPPSHYSGQPGQPGQAGQPGQPGQSGQYGAQPGPYGGGDRRESSPYPGERGEPAPYLGERAEPGSYPVEPGPYQAEPGPYNGERREPGPYGGQPGTPPGDFGSPDKS